MKVSQLFATLTGAAGVAAGNPLSKCSSEGICFSIAVPSSSAQAGSGNIYFQIRAPTSMQWVALGTGSSMTGSNIFVMYQDGHGNLTLSPRLGMGYIMPSLDTSSSAARLNLLAGSGISSDGKTMTANVACPNCQSWATGGSMSLSGTSTPWIAAWKQGSSLATTSQGASIAQHDEHMQFNVDLTKASIKSDANPFNVAVDSSSGDGSSFGPGFDPGSGGIDGISGGGPVRGAVLVGHGVLMALVFCILYPLGSWLMPVFKIWWLHAVWQTIAFALMWAGFGMGLAIGQERNMLFNNTHTTFGVVIVAFMGIQPVLGLLHHRYFVKHQKRGVISYGHIWWGRIMILLGVVNGGLGLQMARERTGLYAAYGVVAGVILVGYAVWVLFCTTRKGATVDGTQAKSHHHLSNGGSGPQLANQSNTPAPRRPYQETRGQVRGHSGSTPAGFV
ncbi:hypothetical protein N0V88_004182 [Collariella sp. IMI 366227]|nr:hypothetical protein N0V88_004182 [Collariella sp. IMI 366227]